MQTYIISTENKDFIKIGKSENIQKRFFSISTSSPYKLILEGHFDCDIESHLHNGFAPYRRHLEWFDHCIIDEIKSMAGFIVNEAKPKLEYKLISINKSEHWKDMIAETKSICMLTYCILNYNVDKNLTFTVKINQRKYMKLMGISSVNTFKKGLKELISKNILTPSAEKDIYIMPADMFVVNDTDKQTHQHIAQSTYVNVKSVRISTSSEK